MHASKKKAGDSASPASTVGRLFTESVQHYRSVNAGGRDAAVAKYLTFLFRKPG